VSCALRLYRLCAPDQFWGDGESTSDFGGAVALAAVLALVAAEKYVCDGHLALKVQSRLQRR